MESHDTSKPTWQENARYYFAFVLFGLGCLFVIACIVWANIAFL